MKRLLVILILALVGCDNAAGKLPPYIKTCRRNETNMARCILKSINAIKPRIVSGNLGPGFEDVPPLDPFFIPSFKVGNTRDFRATFTNVNIKGGGNFIIEKLKANMRDLKFDAIINFPRLVMKGKYDLVFNLFGFRLAGKGDVHAIVDNSRARVSVRARLRNVNGLQYFTFDKILIKVLVGDVKDAYLTNLFGGNSATLVESTNVIIRSQPEFLFQEIYPPVEEYLSQTFTTIANKIAGISTFDEVFPL